MQKSNCRHGCKRCIRCWRNALKHRVEHKGVSKTDVFEALTIKHPEDDDPPTVGAFQVALTELRQRAQQSLEALLDARVNHVCRHGSNGDADTATDTPNTAPTCRLADIKCKFCRKLPARIALLTSATAFLQSYTAPYADQEVYKKYSAMRHAVDTCY